MNGIEGLGRDDLRQREQRVETAQPRAAGTPLPMGPQAQPSLFPEEEEMKQVGPARRGRALASSSSASAEASGLDRAMSVIRQALPFVQRILPVLEGNLGLAVANMLAPRPHPQPQPVPPPVNLEPLQNRLVEIQAQHRDLRTQVAEQNASLKRVEDQLEMMREATDRNTLEQQELLEDLKGVGRRIRFIAVILLILLAGSIAVNVLLLLHIQRVLP